MRSRPYSPPPPLPPLLSELSTYLPNREPLKDSHRHSEDALPLADLDPETCRLLPPQQRKRGTHHVRIQGKLAPVRSVSVVNLRSKSVDHRAPTSSLRDEARFVDAAVGGTVVARKSRRRRRRGGKSEDGDGDGTGSEMDGEDEEEVRERDTQLRGYGIGGAGNIREYLISLVAIMAVGAGAWNDSMCAGWVGTGLAGCSLFSLLLFFLGFLFSLSSSSSSSSPSSGELLCHFSPPETTTSL